MSNVLLYSWTVHRLFNTILCYKCIPQIDLKNTYVLFDVHMLVHLHILNVSDH